MRNLILLIPDQRLKQYQLLVIIRVVDRLRDLECLVEVTVFVVTLGQVELVFGHVGVVFGKLLVDSGGVQEILAHVVAVS